VPGGLGGGLREGGGKTDGMAAKRKEVSIRGLLSGARGRGAGGRTRRKTEWQLSEKLSLCWEMGGNGWHSENWPHFGQSSGKLRLSSKVRT